MIIKIKPGARCKVNGIRYMVRDTEMYPTDPHGLCINPRLLLVSDKGETIDIAFEGAVFAISEASLTGITQFLVN